MSRDTFTPQRANQGTFGEPPPDAPREVAQPIKPETLADQLAQAQANEKTLAPFNPPQHGPNAAEQALVEAAKARLAAKRSGPVEGVQYQPAASETDSPSRGIPTPIDDPGRKITGGWGDVHAAQYNPLDGRELAVLVQHLCGDLVDRTSRDMRFGIAIVYPRVKVTLTLKVEGYVADASFDVKSVREHDKTPEDVAAAAGSKTSFEVQTGRQEFDDEGTPQDPPDRVRDELGLEKPRKQWIGEGANRQMVDVTGKDLF